MMKKDTLSLSEIQEIVFAFRSDAMTSSLIVSEKFGKKHKHVLDKIENILEIAESNQPNFRLIEIQKFNQQNFKKSSYKDDKGRTYPMYLMTVKGFTRLVMSFTGKKADYWKVRFIDAFYSMADMITRQQNISWQSERQTTRESNKILKDAIQKYVEYAKAQGSRNAGHYYSNIARCINKAVFGNDKSERNYRENTELSYLRVAEDMAAGVIISGIAAKLHYKDIYKTLKSQMSDFARMIPQQVQPLPPLPVDSTPLIDLNQRAGHA
jgi:Rha family phage regulatory protein